MELAITPFGAVSAATKRGITAEAEHVASTRQAAEVRITYGS